MRKPYGEGLATHTVPESCGAVRKGCAEHVFAAGFPPLKDLMGAYIEAGGELLVCGPCVNSRKLDPETDFIEGARVVGAGTFVAQFVAASNVLVY